MIATTPWLHAFVSLLLVPVIALLAIASVVAIWECGSAVGERFGGLRRLVQAGAHEVLLTLARRRIERADLLARTAPMLGLMGTLIPLGPGLAGLSRGELQILTDAVQTAFDTTVLGLLVGMAGYVLGRLRRRWYEQALRTLEAAHDVPVAEVSA